jgi:hypothetical protein
MLAIGPIGGLAGDEEPGTLETCPDASWWRAKALAPAQAHVRSKPRLLIVTVYRSAYGAFSLECSRRTGFLIPVSQGGIGFIGRG